MGYRWCRDCEKWLKTYEYDVNEGGDTVCPEDGHGSTRGFILDQETAVDVRATISDYYDDKELMVEKAVEQGIVEP